MTRPRLQVALTGADGIIGRVLRERLATQYDFIPVVRSASTDPAARLADIRDLDALTAAFEGADAVVHLAALANAGGDWQGTLEHNIVGMRNVYEAAVQTGVQQVIFASSNHAVAWHEVESTPALYDLDHERVFSVDIDLRPDSYYGWSKAAGETLGRFYSDAHGLRVICLRIGWVLREDDITVQDMGVEVAPPLSVEQVARRARAIWLSHRDCADVVDAALRSSVPYGVYYAVSDNPRNFYDMQPGLRDLGWHPQDSTPRWFGEPTTGESDR